MVDRWRKQRDRLEKEIEPLEKGSNAWIHVYGQICRLQGMIDAVTVYKQGE